MLKFGFRNKQFYPLMLLLFAFIRNCLELIMDIHPYKDNVGFVIMFLLFFAQTLVNSVIFFFNSKNNIILRKSHSNGSIKLIFNKFKSSNDSKLKIFFLILFASFFYFVGCVIRTNDVINFGDKRENNSKLEVRVRSVQIIISTLICYFAIRSNIYKHQKLSIIFISIFLIFIIIMELFVSSHVLITFTSLFICTM